MSPHIRIPAVAAATAMVLLVPIGPASATDLACIMDLDTGAFSCGSDPSPLATSYTLATL